MENNMGKKAILFLASITILMFATSCSSISFSFVNIISDSSSENGEKSISIKTDIENSNDFINQSTNEGIFHSSSSRSMGSPSIYKSPRMPNYLINNQTLDELYAIYDDLVDNFPCFIKRDENIGIDSSGLEIRQYTVGFNSMCEVVGEQSLYGGKITSFDNVWANDVQQKVILINTGCHGNEKAPCWGVSQGIKQLLESNEEWAMYIKSNYIIKICACMNPYGFNNNQRKNYNGIDLNRDCVQFTQQETQAWKKWVENNLEQSVLYLDMHGTTGYYPYFEYYSNDIHIKDYRDCGYRLNSALFQEWATFYNDETLAPYFFLAESTYEGTAKQHIASLGLMGFTIETPQNIDRPNDNWDNYTKGVKLEIDMLINTIMFLA